MKSNLALINSIGFRGNADKAWYLANILESCLVSAPVIAISPLVPAIASKAAVLAQSAKSARAATVAVTGVANTVGYAFGELYLNSPAYPIGTAIPAIPAKPASAAVVGVPAVVAVAAIPAVNIPAVAAIAGYEGMVHCSATATKCSIEAYLPFDESPKLYGKPTKGISGIKEITPSAIVANQWFDDKSTNTPTSLTFVQSTIEKMLYECALALVVSNPSNNSIETVSIVIGGKNITCHKLVLNLPATAYDLTGESIQLGKLAA